MIKSRCIFPFYNVSYVRKSLLKWCKYKDERCTGHFWEEASFMSFMNRVYLFRPPMRELQTKGTLSLSIFEEINLLHHPIGLHVANICRRMVVNQIFLLLLPTFKSVIVFAGLFDEKFRLEGCSTDGF